MKPLLILTILGSMSLVIPGCSNSTVRVGDSIERASLAEIGEIYRSFSVSNNRPPKDLKELGSMRPVGPSGVKSLEDRTVILFYGGPMNDLNEGLASTSSNKILAYEKKVPESGGDVLMLDRTIKTMTAQEFKTAPKAGQ